MHVLGQRGREVLPKAKEDTSMPPMLQHLDSAKKALRLYAVDFGCAGPDTVMMGTWLVG